MRSRWKRSLIALSLLLAFAGSSHPAGAADAADDSVKAENGQWIAYDEDGDYCREDGTRWGDDWPDWGLTGPSSTKLLTVATHSPLVGIDKTTGPHESETHLCAELVPPSLLLLPDGDPQRATCWGFRLTEGKGVHKWGQGAYETWSTLTISDLESVSDAVPLVPWSYVLTVEGRYVDEQGSTGVVTGTIVLDTVFDISSGWCDTSNPDYSNPSYGVGIMTMWLHPDEQG